MDDPVRKLGIGTGAVALFVGFIFLTRWTGDDPSSVAALGDQERSDLAELCAAVSSPFVADYEEVLRAAAGQFSSGDSPLPPGSQGAQYLIENVLYGLADRVPEEYGGDVRILSEGIERALEGDLEPGDVDEYVDAFEGLQAQAAEDCEELDDLGPVESGPFGDGEFDDGGPFGDGGDGGGGFDQDGDGVGDGGFDDDGGFGDGGDPGFGGSEPPGAPGEPQPVP